MPDEEWDYRNCRCLDDGDHCEYCQTFEWTIHETVPYTRCVKKADEDTD